MTKSPRATPLARGYAYGDNPVAHLIYARLLLAHLRKPTEVVSSQLILVGRGS